MSKEIEIENPSNAFVVIHSKNEKIVIDPWLYDGIYEGTWHNYPRVDIYNDKQNDSNKILCLSTNKDLLVNLLKGNIHWDDACLSIKINWKRIPNYFCSDTMNALNYLKT